MALPIFFLRLMDGFEAETISAYARNEIPFLFPGIPPDSLTFPHLQRIPLLLYRGKVAAVTKSNSK